MIKEEKKKYLDKKDLLLVDLQELQYKIKRGAEHYIPEMIKLIAEFKEQFSAVQQDPASKNERFITLVMFLQGVIEHYKNSLSFLPTYLIELLDNYAEQLNPKIRSKIVVSMIGIRNKHMMDTMIHLTAFFKLLQVKDKELRKMVTAHIINDIKRLNQKTKNVKLNSQIQKLIQNTINTTPNSALAKRCLQILIQLYKKHIFSDPSTINIIANSALGKFPKLTLISCFFLMESTEFPDDASSEEYETFAEKSQKFSKKTKSKEARVERQVKNQKKRERKREMVNVAKSFMPIDQIYQPQDFIEKLYQKLHSNMKFEIKCAVMSVIGRMMFRHRLMLLQFYTLIIRYLQPSQREIGKLLTYLAESVHEEIPTEELQPVIKHIIDQFIGEHCIEDKIVMGINTVREMCFKNHQLLDEFQLNYIADFTTYKERNVNQASKSLVNYYRECNPLLLHKKHRGRFTQINEPEAIVQTVKTGIQGAELLGQDGDFPVFMEKILDDEDFKRIRYLQKKKREQEEIDRQEELQRLREVKYATNQEEEDDDSQISDDFDEEEGDFEEEDFEEEDFEDEEDFDDEDDEDEDEENDEEEMEEQPKKKAAVKKMLTKRKANPLEDSMSDFEESEDQNPHGFIRDGAITHYRKTKAQQKKDERERDDKDKEQKEKAYKGPKQKGGGTNNKEKLKNKNLQMLRPKKNKKKTYSKQVNALQNRVKSIKNQLGHVRSGKQAARRKKLKA